MKKFAATVLAGIVVLSSAGASADSSINLLINGQEVQTEAQPQIVNGRTLIPIRLVAERLGVSVNWDAKRRVIFVSNGKQNVSYTNNNSFHQTNGIRLVINGKEVKPDVPPKIIEGKTLVPIRLIAEELGSSVEWDGAKKVVSVTNKIINPSCKRF